MNRMGSVGLLWQEAQGPPKVKVEVSAIPVLASCSPNPEVLTQLAGPGKAAVPDLSQLTTPFGKEITNPGANLPTSSFPECTQGCPGSESFLWLPLQQCPPLGRQKQYVNLKKATAVLLGAEFLGGLLESHSTRTQLTFEDHRGGAGSSLEKPAGVELGQGTR